MDQDLEKKEFVYMHRQEIEGFIKSGCSVAGITNECRVWIKNVVRRWLKYSCKTADVDIFNGLENRFNKIIL